MEKLTGQQIIDILKEKYATENIAYMGCGDKPEDTPGIGIWQQVDEFGGEGMGDRRWWIKYFTDHDVYIKINGYYQSHYGEDVYGWDSVEVVRPVEKTITVYE